MAPLTAANLLLLCTVAASQQTKEPADLSPPLQLLDDNQYLPTTSTSASTSAAEHQYLPVSSDERRAAAIQLEEKDAAAANYLPTASGTPNPEQPQVISIQPALRVPVRRVIRVRARGSRLRTTTPKTSAVQEVPSSTELSVNAAQEVSSSTARSENTATTETASETTTPTAVSASKEASTGAPSVRRIPAKKRVRVISRVKPGRQTDLAEESATPKTVNALTADAVSEVSTVIPSVVRTPGRRRVRKRNKISSVSAAASRQTSTGASSGTRKIVWKRGSAAGRDKATSVSSAASPDASANAGTPVKKRRRIITKAKNSPATAAAYTEASSAGPTVSRTPVKRLARARQPIDRVAQLTDSTGGVSSVLPLLVRPRVARARGAITIPDAPTTRKIIRRRGRVSNKASVPSASSAASGGAPIVTRKIIRRRGRVADKALSTSTAASQQASTRASSVSQAPIKKRVRVRGKLRRQPIDEATALTDFAGGVSLVRPLLVRPRIARARGATTVPNGVTSAESSSRSGSVQQLPTRRVIRRQGGRTTVSPTTGEPVAAEAATVTATGSAGPPVRRRGSALRRPRGRQSTSLPSVNEADTVRPSSRRGSARSLVRDRAEGSSAPAPAGAEPVTRRIIRRRRPSAGGIPVPTLPTTTIATVPTATTTALPTDTASTLPPITSAFTEGSEDISTTAQLTTGSEQLTATTEQQPTTLTERPGTADQPLTTTTSQPETPSTTEADSETSTVGFTTGSAGLPSVLVRSRDRSLRRRPPVASRASSLVPTDAPTALAPVLRTRKVFRPKSTQRGAFSTASRAQSTAATRPTLPTPASVLPTLPTPRASQPASPLSGRGPIQPAVSSQQSQPEAEADSNGIGELQSTLPAGGGTVVGHRPVSAFSCEGRPYGYYADIEADCQVFHICTPVVQASGTQQMLKHSFFCNNGTVFDQRTLSCRVTTAALACDLSADYYASVDFFAQYNYFDQLRADHEREERLAKRQEQQRLETLADLARLEAQLA